MYYIGIDISKFKHDCAVIDELCEASHNSSYGKLFVMRS